MSTAVTEATDRAAIEAAVDFFTLAKIGGTWKIVNKTFAHTGGEMPAS
jgi:Putative lumazine-binding